MKGDKFMKKTLSDERFLKSEKLINSVSITKGNSISLVEQVNIDKSGYHLKITSIDFRKLKKAKEEHNAELHFDDETGNPLRIDGSANISIIKVILDDGRAEFNVHRKGEIIASHLTIMTIPRRYGLQNLYGTPLPELQERYYNCIKKLESIGINISIEESHIAYIEYCLDYKSDYNMNLLAKPIAYAVRPSSLTFECDELRKKNNERNVIISTETIIRAELCNQIIPVEFRNDRFSYSSKVYLKSYEMTYTPENKSGTTISDYIIRVEYMVDDTSTIFNQLKGKTDILKLAQEDIEDAFLGLSRRNIQQKIKNGNRKAYAELKKYISDNLNVRAYISKALLYLSNYEKSNGDCYICLCISDLIAVFNKLGKRSNQFRNYLYEYISNDPFTNMCFSDNNLLIQNDFLNHVMLSADTYMQPYTVNYVVREGGDSNE